MTPEYSGWMNTDAVRFCACPKGSCQAKPGEPCRTPKGRKAKTHWQRTQVFVAQERASGGLKRYQRKVLPGAGLLDLLKKGPQTP